jgi:hypothetical protein
VRLAVFPHTLVISTISKLVHTEAMQFAIQPIAMVFVLVCMSYLPGPTYYVIGELALTKESIYRNNLLETYYLKVKFKGTYHRISRHQAR